MLADASVTTYSESVGNGNYYYLVQASNAGGASSFTSGGPTAVSLTAAPSGVGGGGGGGGGCGLSLSPRDVSSSAAFFLPYVALILGISILRRRTAAP